MVAGAGTHRFDFEQQLLFIFALRVVVEVRINVAAAIMDCAQRTDCG